MFESASAYGYWLQHMEGDIWELIFSMEDLEHYRIKDGSVSLGIK